MKYLIFLMLVFCLIGCATPMPTEKHQEERKARVEGFLNKEWKVVEVSPYSSDPFTWGATARYVLASGEEQREFFSCRELGNTPKLEVGNVITLHFVVTVARFSNPQCHLHVKQMS